MIFRIARDIFDVICLTALCVGIYDMIRHNRRLHRQMNDLQTKTEWFCQNCGSSYVEYINGCPHCWSAGIRSGVIKIAKA